MTTYPIADAIVGDAVIVPVKSKYLSKTNITGVLLAVLGVLTALGYVPAAAATPEVVGSVVAAGGVLVVFFRTIAGSVLK